MRERLGWLGEVSRGSLLGAGLAAAGALLVDLGVAVRLLEGEPVDPFIALIAVAGTVVCPVMLRWDVAEARLEELREGEA